MLILGIETSGPTASVAILRDGELLAEHILHHTRTHSEAVMPMLERLMEELDLIPADIGAIAVNCGPGSFTGVRIGVCTANAMGAALHIPVIGVDSLRALYKNVDFWPGSVCAVVDAGNGNAYFAQYDGNAQTAEPSAAIASAYIPSVPAHSLFVGDGTAAYADIIGSVTGAVIAPAPFSISRASALCRAAQELLSAGETPMQTAPLYLRPSQAERMWSKSHEKAE
jgi:tRNA threonylcarbamoyladenosine biosynthesis protein TsaB